METVSMSDREFNIISSNFERLKYGVSNKEIKDLHLRDFTKRVQRYENKQKVSLYALKPEVIEYVKDKGECTAILPVTPDYSSKLQLDVPCSIVPLSTSSTLIEECSTSYDTSKSGKLAKDICDSILFGRCELGNVFERVLLIRKYFDRLSTDGLTAKEIGEIG